MVAFVLTTSLIACKYKEYYGRTPCDQPDTIWISEDGSISIQVNSYQQATGTLWVENQKITFIFTAVQRNGRIATLRLLTVLFLTMI